MAVGVDRGAQPSAWAVDRFGDALAERLWRRVPQAIAAAVDRAVDAHKESQLDTAHVFGSARWVGQYQALATWLGDLEDAQLITPPGRFYQVRSLLATSSCPGSTLGRPVFGCGMLDRTSPSAACCGRWSP